MITDLLDLFHGNFSDIGYLAVFFVLLLDGASIPFTPIELFLGLTGYLVAIDELGFAPAYVVTILGNLAGHIISYFAGYWLGKPFFRKFGRYLLITPERLEKGEQVVKRLGPLAAFVLRFIPGVRAISSPLLGTIRMPFAEFILLTLPAVALWNLGFILLGLVFGLAFAAEASWIVPLIIAVIAVGFCLAAVLWYRVSSRQKNPV